MEGVPMKAKLLRLENPIEGDLKNLYDTLKQKIEVSVAQKQFSADSVRPLLLSVIAVVENFTKDRQPPMDGSAKKALAMELTRYVFKDLHDSKQIPDDVYEWTMLGLEFFGPALFDGLKAVYNKAVTVVQDIQDNGTSGCCGRNFGRRQAPAGRGN